VIAAIAVVAFPAAGAAIWGLIRSPLARRLVAPPRSDRWHDQVTPTFGGIGIFLGFAVGVGAALATGAVHGTGELYGIVGGCGLLFVAGLADDVFALPPVAKVAAQGGAAAIALIGGVKVEIVSNDILGTAIAVVWLVGMTNAFNLLDNMDGLAATLAGIACVYFAIDAVTSHPNRMVLVLALSLGLACAGFLPFNLRPGKPAATFMGDSGSQVLGFSLAALGLASSWKVAGSTVAALLLPILVLAVPILDTTLVTVVRLLEGRPIYQGGRDHTSHRLVYHGLSERRAVVFLAVIAAALGATSLAYTTLANTRVTLVGVLLTFALLVQFGSFLSDIERSPQGMPASGNSLVRTFVVHRRRLIEVLVDFALVCACFLAAYLLRVEGQGTVSQRSVFLVSLPIVLAARYLAFIPFGLYRGVWRYAGARDAAAVIAAVVTSEIVAFGFLSATKQWEDFPRSIFVIDALLCGVVVGASRFGERALWRAVSSLRRRGERSRTLIVGAGRGGRSLMRELRETPGEQVVGFVDDDPRLRRRRLQGVPVVGGIDEMSWILERTQPDTVLVTIPQADPQRLAIIVQACTAAQVPCHFVQRETNLAPPVILRAASE
jgi:UDP-GlcNAc:undecaprenyl-phosphate GlcNAc-1-phosphate transferase